MSGEGDKKQIQGISEMPEVPWLWDDPGKPGEHEPGEEGELVGIPVLEEGDSQEPVGGEMQEFGVEEEEVVRLGVSAERVRRFKSGGVERMNPGGVDRELGVDPGLEGEGWEEDADVEGSWNEGERRGSPIGLIAEAMSPKSVP